MFPQQCCSVWYNGESLKCLNAFGDKLNKLKLKVSTDNFSITYSPPLLLQYLYVGILLYSYLSYLEKAMNSYKSASLFLCRLHNQISIFLRDFLSGGRQNCSEEVRLRKSQSKHAFFCLLFYKSQWWEAGKQEREMGGWGGGGAWTWSPAHLLSLVPNTSLNYSLLHNQHLVHNDKLKRELFKIQFKKSLILQSALQYVSHSHTSGCSPAISNLGFWLGIFWHLTEQLLLQLVDNPTLPPKPQLPRLWGSKLMDRLKH